MESAPALPPDLAPCWRTIGVWGREEPRCPELERVVHCRNCDVFRAAGRRLFDAPPPDDYGNDWVEMAADPSGGPSANIEPALVVRVGAELLALPLSIVKQVHAWRPVCRIPHRQTDVLLGLVNIDGELQLCASLEALGDESRVAIEAPPRGRMIAVGTDTTDWVLPVDEAIGLPLVALDSLEDAPVTLVRSDRGFVRGVFTYRGSRVGLVDDGLLLALLARSLA